MRSGTCVSSQQTLTPEAASVLKHSLSLAARRGHSHVTPLHVASTLLSSKPLSSISLLRRACLKSHPPHHPTSPLQSRALELCFNVALNRLPTSPPLLHSPSLSNALIAALKRAQAHQRRGSSSIDHGHHHHQQHPLLTIKVELQHLIVSILDDPSVSRVMREAGFSSTAVKNNIEEYTSSSNNISSSSSIFISPQTNPISHFFSTTPQTNQTTPLFFSSPSFPSANIDATKFVFDVFLGRKSSSNYRSHNNVVVVGDSVGVTEGVVFEVMRKFKMGDVPEEMKGVKVLAFPFMGVSSSSLNYVCELRRKLGECNNDQGVVVYVGDLKWIVEGNNNDDDEEVDVFVREIQRLLKGDFNNNNNNNNNGDGNYTTNNNDNPSKIKKIWVMAVASYQIYMRCQMRQPPLETQWALHAVPVPSAGLGLTLHASSVYDSRLSFFSQAMETKPFITKVEEHEKLTCCAECTSNFENEVQHLKSFQSKQVPSWLQHYNANQSHSKEEFMELKRKWNKLCSSLHRDGSVQNLMGKSFSYSSSYPWWPKFHESNSISFTDHQTPKPLQSSNFVPKFIRQQSCTTIEFDFGDATTKHNQDREPSLNSLKNMVGKEVKITLALGNPLFRESSAESTEIESERKTQRGEILKILQENVPWQSESLSSIAEAVISAKKNEKSIQWILLEGNDSIGKRKMAIAIAESVFGSVDFLLNLNAKCEEMGISRAEMVEKALKSNRELVILVEHVDMADTQFMKFLENGFESGKLGEATEETIGEVIFVLTKDDSSEKMKNRASIIEMALKFESREKTNIDQKRKAEWEIENKSKNQRINTTHFENQHNRQSTTNKILDLNLKATNEEEEEEQENLPNEQISPISSDVTRETTIYDLKSANGLVESISNRFVLGKKHREESEIKEKLRGEMEGAYKEICKKGNWDWDWDNCRFRVEEGILDGILDGFGTFSKKMFEKWVKEIFQTGLLEGGRYGGKEEGGIDIKLCLGKKHILEEEEEGQNGYMGSCLPKKIKLL